MVVGLRWLVAALIFNAWKEINEARKIDVETQINNYSRRCNTRKTKRNKKAKKWNIWNVIWQLNNVGAQFYDCRKRRKTLFRPKQKREINLQQIPIYRMYSDILQPAPNIIERYVRRTRKKKRETITLSVCSEKIHRIGKNVTMWNNTHWKKAPIKSAHRRNERKQDFFSQCRLDFFSFTRSLSIEYFMNWTNCYTIFKRFRLDLCVRIHRKRSISIIYMVYCIRITALYTAKTRNFFMCSVRK